MRGSGGTPFLTMRQIGARYGDVVALRNVDFDLRPGEIHALVGEHRAGKSTLVKVLSGALRKQSGEIVLAGKTIDYFTPRTSLEHRIGMLYQEMSVVPTLNAVENIFAGQIPVRWLGKADYRQMVERARGLFQRLGVDISLDVPLQRLTMAEQLMVELARMLSTDPRLIIFDEISSKLTPVEMERVYPILFDAKQSRKGIIYISHNMDEILTFADRVTVLKDGCKVGTEQTQGLDRMKLIRMTYSFVLSREELEQDNKELHTIKTYNESILRNLPVGVVILDARDRLYMINVPAARILNVSREGAVDRTIRDLGEGKLPLCDEIAVCVRDRRWGRWDEARLEDGKTLKISTFPFQDEDGTFLGTIVLLEDVTRDVMFDEYLLRTERVASVAELAAGIAHEINNPLGIILNHTDLLKRKSMVVRGGLEKVEIIESELHRIKAIISTLLSFSRIDDTTMEPVDLRSVVDDVVVLIQYRLAEKEIHFKRRSSPHPAVVRGNKNGLKQVLINLLLNSIEAVGRGGAIEVRLDVDPGQAVAVLEVADDGCGIPEAIRGRVFDPFFSTKGDHGNTGLGLSISQHVVETHGGFLDLRTDDHTVFAVHLPLVVRDGNVASRRGAGNGN